MDRAEIFQQISKLTGRKRKPQSKYSDENRYTIEKYAKDNDASQAAKFFKNKYPTINESTVRTFVKKYDENVKVEKACGRSPDRKLKTLMRGRPLMVGPIIDEKVRKRGCYDYMGKKVCYRELGLEGKQQLLAKLKYRIGQRKKQVYNIIIASQV